MNHIVAALDDRTQDELRDVLATHSLDRLGRMREETIAAVAMLGRHPEDLRASTLSIMPIGIREELYAARLVERRSPGSDGWELTPLGHDVAQLLARTLPTPDADAQQRAREALDERLAKVQRQFGPLE